MKKSLININSMILVFLVYTAIILVSCDKEENIEATLSEDEAAEQVSSILTSDINSLTQDIDQLVKAAEAKSGSGRVNDLSCNVAYDTAISYNYAGTYISLNVDVDYEYEFTCNLNVPNGILIDFKTESSYEGTRLSSTATSDGSFSGSFAFTSDEYVLGGSFSRNSTIQQKQRGKNTLVGESSITVKDLAIDKSTQKVTSGSATVSATGTTSNGGTYQFTADISFEGNGIGIITIREYQYSVNMLTGDITAL